jgi:hypothetical protein
VRTENYDGPAKDSAPQTTPQVVDEFHNGLMLLWPTNLYARDAGFDSWGIALEIDE